MGLESALGYGILKGRWDRGCSCWLFLLREEQWLSKSRGICENGVVYLSLTTNNQRHYARIPNLTLARWDA